MNNDFRYLSTFSMTDYPPCGVALMRSDKLTELHKSMGYHSANMEMCLPALLSIFKHMQADWEDGRNLYPALVPIRSHLGSIIKEIEEINECITEWHKQLGKPTDDAKPANEAQQSKETL
jgi:hypothetical protein